MGQFGKEKDQGTRFKENWRKKRRSKGANKDIVNSKAIILNVEHRRFDDALIYLICAAKEIEFLSAFVEELSLISYDKGGWNK